MTPQPGSIILGTLHPEKLIQAFVTELGRLDPHVASEFRVHCDHPMTDYDASEIISALTDLLDEQAGDELRFGAREDGSTDFGFWPIRKQVPA